jgi:S1-C subfamily serine protease
LRGRARTISGEFAIHEGVLSGSVQFAGITVDQPTIVLNDRFDWGNLGSESLAQSVLTIDQVNQRLSIAPGDTPHSAESGGAAGQPIKQMAASPTGKPPRLGVALAFGPEFIRIEQVLSGGLAEKSGLQPGDLIRSINGEQVTPDDQPRLGELLGQSPLTIQVERDGNSVDVTIQSPD